MILTPIEKAFPQSPEKKAKITPITFAGEKSDTANVSTLRQAREMEKSGSVPVEIWRETGWMRGLDDKWKYEISDVGAGVKDGKFYHPELEKAYPGIFKEWNFEVRSAEQDAQLANEPDTFGYSDLANKTIVVRDTLAGEDQRSIFVHEFQHAVQAEEGFTVGGSPYSRETANISAVKQGKGWFGQLMSNFGVGVDPNVAQHTYETYGGEAEARATQSRMYMNDQERRDYFPLRSYDVSIKDVKETERLRNGSR